MDFQLSDEQQLLRDSVRTFTKQRSPLSRFRKVRDHVGDRGAGWDAAVWREMGELGWLSLPFPEAAGGFGGTMVDVGLLLENFGATLVPEPYLASVVVAGTALLRAGTAEQHARWLAPMIDGQTSLALAHDERAHRFDVRPRATTAVRSGDAWTVRGTKHYVSNGERADVILVSATDGDTPLLFAVPRDHAALRIEGVRTIDGLGAATVSIDGEIGDEHRLSGGDATIALERAHDAGAAMAVAEGVGICQAVLELTVGHLRSREQFGVAIGTFQALQHRAVEMFVEVELLRSMAVLAAIRADDDDDVRRPAVSAAKAKLATAGRFVTQQAIQLHGGIGITDEHDVGLYFKRMHALGVAFGDEEHHVRRFVASPSFTAEL